MALTPDKTHSMVKKVQTMTEAHVDVRTTDGYLLHLFCVGFTKTRNNQMHKSPTRSITRSTRSGKRWKSRPEKCRQMTWRECSNCFELANCFQTTWGKIQKSLAIPFIWFTLSVSGKEKCPRNPSLSEKTHGAPWWRFWKNYWWWDCRESHLEWADVISRRLIETNKKSSLWKKIKIISCTNVLWYF